MGSCNRYTGVLVLPSDDADIWLMSIFHENAGKRSGYAPVGERLVKQCQSRRESDLGLGLICWITREAFIRAVL